MKRPQQQILFGQANKALTKQNYTKDEMKTIYKAFNLSLTSHESYEVSSQNRFYGELKKKGYDALLDYNDKEYSSYHAKHPVIVFNTSAVKLKACTNIDDDTMNKFNAKYNRERVRKEMIASGMGLAARYAGAKATDIKNVYYRRMNAFADGK